MTELSNMNLMVIAGPINRWGNTHLIKTAACSHTASNYLDFLLVRQPEIPMKYASITDQNNSWVL